MNDSEDIRRIFRPLLQRWYLILLGSILGTANGWKTFHEAIPSYQCRATIQINDKHSSLAKYMEDFEDFSMTGKYEVELSLMRSKHVAWEGLKKLDVEIFYYVYSQGHYRNAYAAPPFRIHYEFRGEEFKDQQFELEIRESGELLMNVPNEEDRQLSGGIGQWMKGDGWQIRLVPDSLTSLKAGKYAFQVNSKQGLLETLANMEVLWIRLQNEKTPIINLYTWNEVPELAADVANVVAHAYIDFYLDSKLELAGLSLTAIDLQLDSLHARMVLLERQIADFQSRHLAWNAENAIKNTQKQLKDLNRLSLNYRFHEQALQVLEEGLKLDSLETKMPQTFEALRDQGFVTHMREWEKWSQKRRELARRYTEIHPGLVRLDRLLEDLSRDIRLQVEQTQDQQAFQLVEIDQQIKEAEDRILELIQLQTELLGLEREAGDLDLAYMELIDKRTEAVISAAADFHFHRMLEHAVPAIEPIKPVFHVVVGLKGLMGGLYTILLIVLYRLLLARMSHKSDLSIVSRLPLLATIRQLSSQVSEGKLDMIALASDLHFRPEIRLINLISYRQQEGKTDMAIELAKSFAALGMKTLLLNADPHQQRIASSLGLAVEKGLGHLLKNPDVSQISGQPSSISGLHVLGLGWEGASVPSQLIHHVRLPEVMEALTKEYEYIILNLPVLFRSQDAFSLLSYGDITLYTVRNHISKFSQIKKTEQILRDLPAPRPHIVFCWGDKHRTWSLSWRKAKKKLTHGKI
ncbi:MAG: hypothetical protein AAF587_07375 [Bacteroidota bacterium]